MLFIITLLVFGFIVFVFYLVSKSIEQSSTSVSKRLEKYTTMAKEAESARPKEIKEQKSIFEALDKKIEKKSFSEKIYYDLRKADLRLRVTEYLAFRLVITTLMALIGFLLWKIVGMLGLGIAGFFVMPFYVKRCQKRRQRAFANQIEDALTLISNSLKAGYSFLQAVEMIAREMPPPMKTEFTRVLDENRLGMDLEESLTKLAKRLESDDFDLVVTAVLIQRETGGNLAEILDNIANTIRERVKLKLEIMALTAMGRMSGMIICSLPIVLTVILFKLNPEFMGLLFTTMIGKGMIAAGVLSMGMGVMMIKKIIEIEV